MVVNNMVNKKISYDIEKKRKASKIVYVKVT
jgi:hypothetical protein